MLFVKKNLIQMHYEPVLTRKPDFAGGRGTILLRRTALLPCGHSKRSPNPAAHLTTGATARPAHFFQVASSVSNLMKTPPTTERA